MEQGRYSLRSKSSIDTMSKEQKQLKMGQPKWFWKPLCLMILAISTTNAEQNYTTPETFFETSHYNPIYTVEAFISVTCLEYP